ncbi:hypothetical protein PR202_gb19950 [Eleusine coracana subsp. coracana]|uniref:C2 domain-containing protein n=1 Tax=Eleusine coracana subsp. coracana TaxID=191504 RepID=A0AAV5F7A2_ELECO|nr:hypothetical protein PR202_gb19950 [Eleusine coracana subsp. coracana]
MMVRERTWRRVVVVEVCNARNLKPKDRQGTTCVYAVVDFDGQRRCTGAATCSGDLNLQWGEMLKFRVHDPDTMVLKTLKLNLYNEKKAIAAAGSGRRNRTFLGKVQITGASFAKEGEEVLSYYPLQKWSVFSQIKGEIGLKIWFVDEPEPHDMLYLGTLVPQNFDQLSISDDENMDSTLPMEMVEGLEDVVSLAASSPAKPTVSTATSQENNHEPSPLTPPSKGPAWEEFLSSWSEARLLQHSLQMDTYNALERMLVDESEEPRPLTLSLLETITNNFSEDMKVGSGGFSVVYKVGEASTALITIGLIAGILEARVHADKASYYCREHLVVRWSL